jgi:hypothetical protein
MAIYNISQMIGVKAIIRNIDNNWNQNDELRALASFIVRISTANRNRDTVIAVQNQKELCKIVLKNHTVESNGFQIISTISQLHSNKFIAV